MADLWKRWIAETLAMSVVISIGNGAITNEVLKRTKGHALGLGFVAIAWGMAFFTAIIMFGHISATVNPALLVAKALLGRLSWKDAIVLSIANVVGGFLGGVLVYGLYFAHFSIVPERPSPPKWDDAVVHPSFAPPVHTRDALISYEPRPRFLGAGVEAREQAAFAYRPARAGTNGGRNVGRGVFQRSNSIQVATILHEHDKSTDAAYVAATTADAQTSTTGQNSQMLPSHKSPSVFFARGQQALNSLGDAKEGSPVERNKGVSPGGITDVGGRVEGIQTPSSDCDNSRAAEKIRVPTPLRVVLGTQFGGVQLHEEASTPDAPRKILPLFRSRRNKPPHTARNAELTAGLESEGFTDDDIALYLGTLVADQNAKLSCFASRPAVFNYVTNMVAEVICTFMLVWTALMLEERAKLLDTSDVEDNVFAVLSPLLIGFLVVGLVTSMAGPTGYAANPARDLGPRLAHFVLPIPNKGPTEWYYAVVPIVGPFIGGILAAVVFFGCIHLNDYPDWFDGDIDVFGGSWDL